MVGSTCGQYQLLIIWPSGISHMGWVANVLLEFGSWVESKTLNRKKRNKISGSRRSKNLFWGKGSDRAGRGRGRLRWRALLLNDLRPQNWSVLNLSILAICHWPLSPGHCSRWPSADLWPPLYWWWVSPLRKGTKEVIVNFYKGQTVILINYRQQHFFINTFHLCKTQNNWQVFMYLPWSSLIFFLFDISCVKNRRMKHQLSDWILWVKLHQIDHRLF